MAHCHISGDDRSDSSTLTRDRLCIYSTHIEPHYPGTPRVSMTYYQGSPRVSASYHPASNSQHSLSDVISIGKSRRRSTIHSYNLVNYYALPQDPATLRTVRKMKESKALKNVIVLGLAFMFVHTAFVSILSLQSIMNPEGWAGVVSISCIYATTVISCMLAPWIIDKITAKWTMVVAFVLFTLYFAGNFYPKDFMLIPLGLTLGFLGGPLLSAQATFITTLALTYAQHSHIFDQDTVINKYMSIFCGFYRSSYIWGNLITTLVLANNQTLSASSYNISSMNTNQTIMKVCGSASCSVTIYEDGEENYNIIHNMYDTVIPETTKYMLLSIYLGCGIMGAVILLALLDKDVVGSKNLNAEVQITTKELFMSTIKMLKDSRCQLLIPLVLFVGLEQGFIFGDFTKVGTCYRFLVRSTNRRFSCTSKMNDPIDLFKKEPVLCMNKTSPKSNKDL